MTYSMMYFVLGVYVGLRRQTVTKNDAKSSSRSPPGLPRSLSGLPGSPKALGTVLGGANVTKTSVFTAIYAFLELIRRSPGSRGSGVINYDSGPPFHARLGSG